MDRLLITIILVDKNTGKNQTKKLCWKTAKNTGKVRESCQPVIVKNLQI